MSTFTAFAGKSKRVRWRRLIGALALVTVLLVTGALAPLSAGQRLAGEQAPLTVREAVAKERQSTAKRGLRGTSERRGGVDGQIVGGTEVANGRYPFIVALRIAAPGGGFFLCGGSVLDSTHVLTAAHCTEDLEGNDLPASAFGVGVGKTDRSKFCNTCYIRVSQVFVHPAWDATTYANDVAVLKLSSPIPAKTLKAVNLVGRNETTYDVAGQAVKLAGWGTRSEGGSPATNMREATVKVVGAATCDDKYPPGEVISAVMLCAAAKGKDSCQGDSGGPLFVKLVEQRPGKDKVTKIQTGIVSWGYGCARRNFPGVYTRLSAPVIHDFITTALAG